MSEGELKFEQEKPKEIKDAENFQELYDILGSTHAKEDWMLVGKIEAARTAFISNRESSEIERILKEGSYQINQIPEELKEKVVELLKKEIDQRNIEEKIESYDAEIVRHNLEMLKKNILASMNQESMGGNAGNIKINGKKYICVGVNAHIQTTTGKIIIFTNNPIMDKELETKSDITFKVAATDNGPKIVNVYAGTLSGDNLRNIIRAVDLYNVLLLEESR